MKLTTGQKNALIRKATEIIEAKKAAEREKLSAEYKIKDAKAMQEFDTYRELLRKFQRLIDYAKELGYSADYYSGLQKSFVADGQQVNLCFRIDNSITDQYKNVYTRFKERQIDDILDKKYPSYESIQDEIELQTLSKDFDINAFIAKYENL